MRSLPNALNYFYEFSPLLIQEMRSVLEQFNAGDLDAKAAFAAWRKALDQEIADRSAGTVRQWVVWQFVILRILLRV